MTLRADVSQDSINLQCMESHIQHGDPNFEKIAVKHEQHVEPSPLAHLRRPGAQPPPPWAHRKHPPEEFSVFVLVSWFVVVFNYQRKHKLDSQGVVPSTKSCNRPCALSLKKK